MGYLVDEGGRKNEEFSEATGVGLYHPGLTDAPIRYVMSYLLFTLALFILEYYDTRPNAVFVLVYCLVNFAALFVGWTYRRRSMRILDEFVFGVGTRLLLYVSCIATILVSWNNVFAFYTDLSQAFTYAIQPGVAYEYVKYVGRNSIVTGATSLPSGVGVILTALTFTKYYVATLAVLYWRELRLPGRVLVLITALVYIFQSFAIGAMVNVGSLLIASSPVILLYVGTRRRASRVHRQAKSGRARRRMMLFAGLSLVTMLYFLGSRGVFMSEDGTSLAPLVSGLLGMVFYLSHGYAGLSYCLELPFVFTWGHTSFRGFAGVLLPYLGVTSRWGDSYLARSETVSGWSALQVWSTVFPWLASDISFWLIPLVFMVLGLSMKRAWIRGISTRNPFALAYVGQLLIFCAMVPANNQLFNTFGNSVAAVTIWAMYRISVRRASRTGSQGGLAT